MKQVTDTSKAILWWNGLDEHGKINAIAINLNTIAPQAYKIWNECQGMITDEKIQEIYVSCHLSEHPQPTDTGNTVSSEVGFTGGEWKVKDRGIGRLGIAVNPNDALLCNDICSLFGNSNDEETKANARLIAAAPALVSALKELIKVATDTTANLCGFDGADELDNCIDKAKELLTTINQTK